MDVILCALAIPKETGCGKSGFRIPVSFKQARELQDILGHTSNYLSLICQALPRRADVRAVLPVVACASYGTLPAYTAVA